MGEFFKNAWAFIQTNWIWFVVGVVALIALIIIISSISRARKKRRIKAELDAKIAAKRTASKPVATPERNSPSDEQTVTVAENSAPITETAYQTADNTENSSEADFSESDNAHAADDEAQNDMSSAANQPAETQKESEEEQKTESAKATEKNTKTLSKENTKGQKKQLKNVGRWTIAIKAKGEYTATLAANNGEVMLSSETYTTEEGARNGIATIINGVANGKFIIYCDKNGNYYYKLKSTGNRLLCVGEIYKSKDQCLKAVETVKRIAAQASISDVLQEGTEYVEYTPIKVDGYEAKKGLLGKWRVEKTESGNYSAKLYASNGQLMLATEEVALLKSAEKAIESVRKNSLAGNFIIDRDKFGRYYYKLRNAQKSVICIGEAYDTFESCVNALESVRRFAATAVYKE